MSETPPPGGRDGDSPPGTRDGDSPPGTRGGDSPPGTRGGDSPPGTRGGDSPPGTRGGDSPPSPSIRHVELKARLLLGLIVLLLAGFLGFVLYARGVFEPTQRLVLVVDNAEGLSVGTDLTYSGFPIGRVQRIELAPTGQARVELTVPTRSAHWLRTSSVFTLERGLVGAARLRAFTGDTNAPPLPDGAERPLLRGDANEEIPLILTNVKGIVQNIERVTAADSDLNASIANLRALTEKMSGRYGVLGAMLGEDRNAAQVLASVERANRLLDSLNGLSAKLGGTLAQADRAIAHADQAIAHADQILARADQRVLGAGGVLDEAQKTVEQLNGAIADARASLKKADAVLADAQKVSGNAAAATADLGTLRAEVEASLRRVGSLIQEINRKWPFARDTEIKLP